MGKSFFYKYIHLMYGRDTKFSGLFVKLFNDIETGFNPDEHLFITPYKNVYNELCQYSNVILDESKKNLYIKYHKHCNLMISHGSESKLRIVLTPNSIKRKIVYRYWGGSRTTGFKYDSKNPFINLKQKFLSFFMRETYAHFAGIGVANIVDILDLSRVLRADTKYYRLNYSNESYNIIKSIKEEKKEPNKKLNVLLGHRGTAENNHIDILEKLEKYDPNRFDIYIPLSYGNSEYISNIKNHIKKYNYKNIIIIEDMMPFYEYVKLLSQMDIGIFDGVTSYALGNICILLGLRKTLYLNDEGIIAQALNLEGGYYRKISDIGEITFEEFSKLIVFPDEYKSKLNIMGPQELVEEWNRLLKQFDF